MSAIGKAHHAIWRLRKAWAEAKIAEAEDQLRSLRGKLWRIKNREPSK